MADDEILNRYRSVAIFNVPSLNALTTTFPSHPVAYNAFSNVIPLKRYCPRATVTVTGGRAISTRASRSSTMAERTPIALSYRHQTPTRVLERLIELRKEHPKWGPRKLRARLEALGDEVVPAASTISTELKNTAWCAPVVDEFNHRQCFLCRSFRQRLRLVDPPRHHARADRARPASTKRTPRENAPTLKDEVATPPAFDGRAAARTRQVFEGSTT
jgi:hypothetical protein